MELRIGDCYNYKRTYDNDAQYIGQYMGLIDKSTLQMATTQDQHHFVDVTRSKYLKDTYIPQSDVAQYTFNTVDCKTAGGKKRRSKKHRRSNKKSKKSRRYRK
jgi:hypothetical protein